MFDPLSFFLFFLHNPVGECLPVNVKSEFFFLVCLRACMRALKRTRPMEKVCFVILYVQPLSCPRSVTFLVKRTVDVALSQRVT